MTTAVDPTSPIAGFIDRVVAVFDDELRSDVPFVNRLVEQVRRYRGKLLRPKLLLLAGRSVGPLSQDHVVLAAVVEMVHMATLVHDDVLDEAEVRRRGATINHLIGNEGAVLLGDTLISHAYHLCSSLGSTHASRRIAAVTNTVCEGELMQIHNRGNLALREADYLEIIRRKTASLTSICCELGAKVGGADSDTVTHLAAYGEDLGMAFQITDDLLDLTGTENETGKTVGRDADLGTLTLPIIRFLAGPDSTDRQALVDILSSGESHKTEQVRELILRSDCIDQAFSAARDYVSSAMSHLGHLPDSDAKASLMQAAEFVMQRRQ